MAEYVKAKATLESLLKTCETKLLKCTSPELPGFSKDAVAVKDALMTFTRKSADRLLHARGKILKEEDLALRQVVADYRKRYVFSLNLMYFESQGRNWAQGQSKDSLVYCIARTQDD